MGGFSRSQPGSFTALRYVQDDKRLTHIGESTQEKSPAVSVTWKLGVFGKSRDFSLAKWHSIGSMQYSMVTFGPRRLIGASRQRPVGRDESDGDRLFFIQRLSNRGGGVLNLQIDYLSEEEEQPALFSEDGQDQPGRKPGRFCFLCAGSFWRRAAPLFCCARSIEAWCR